MSPTTPPASCTGRWTRPSSKEYQARAGVDLTVRQSHGGSGRQARSVIDGLDADVVTLALAYDIDAIADRGLLPQDWQKRLPRNSSPYTSTIVFLVRKGNPRQIHDWDDLVKDGVQVITPNPKTSGRARWNYLAAWAYALARNEAASQGARIRGPVAQPCAGAGYGGARLDHHVRRARRRRRAASLGKRGLPGARGAGAGQIRHRGAVAVHPGRTACCGGGQGGRPQGTRAAAQAYLEYLYTPAAQEIIARNFYRPTDETVAARYASRFPKLKLVTIDDPIFGGWRKAQKDHFSDGGTFDQVYQPQRK